MQMLLRLFEQAQVLAEQRMPFAIALVAETKGSAPARAGSMMLVKQSGETAGTIGGSDVEEKSRIESLRCLQNHSTSRQSYTLSVKKPSGEDLACGGEANIWAFPVFGQHDLPSGRIAQLIRQRKQFIISIFMFSDHARVYAIDNEGYISGGPQIDDANFIRQHYLSVLSDKRHVIKSHRDNPVFFAYVRPMPHVLLCGGGHIHFELAKLLDNLGYFYSVCDSRPAFAGKNRFPGAKSLFRSAEEADINDFSHISIASHSQSEDFHAVKIILKQNFKGFTGLIGSKSKRKDFSNRLDGERIKGFENVECPIGAGISVDSVQEIAVSIAAKIIDTHNRAG